MSIGETETAGGGRSRWTAAARAYADELLDSEFAGGAAAAGLDAAARSGRIDDRTIVLDSIRMAVAQRVTAPARTSAAAGSAGAVCPLVPKLLAARAADRLSAADGARLARHIQSCPDCAALERRAIAAEQAFEAQAPDLEPLSPRPVADESDV